MSPKCVYICSKEFQTPAAEKKNLNDKGSKDILQKEKVISGHLQSLENDQKPINYKDPRFFFDVVSWECSWKISVMKRNFQCRLIFLELLMGYQPMSEVILIPTRCLMV